MTMLKRQKTVFSHMKLLSPAANPHTKTAQAVQKTALGFQVPLMNLTTAQYRSKAMPTNVRLLTKIAAVEANGTRLHSISPRL